MAWFSSNNSSSGSVAQALTWGMAGLAGLLIACVSPLLTLAGIGIVCTACGVAKAMTATRTCQSCEPYASCYPIADFLDEIATAQVIADVTMFEPATEAQTGRFEAMVSRQALISRHQTR
jgi:hypothetical protein